MLFTESRASKHEIWSFLLECREDEERRATLFNKEASESVLEMTVSFTDVAIFTKL